MKNKMGLVKLSENAMRDVKAQGTYTWVLQEGKNCGCGCYNSSSGGSSSDDNANANWGGNQYSLVR
jgi:hypothetical protein